MKIKKPPTRAGMPTRADQRQVTQQTARWVLRSKRLTPCIRRHYAAKWSACSDQKPCRSAVCLACSLDHQRKALRELETIWPPGTKLVVGTVVIPKLSRPLGQLYDIQLKSVVQSFRRRLRRAGCANIPIWGYIDLSFNEHAQQHFPSHWQPHVHFVAEAKHAARLKKGFKRAFRLDRKKMITGKRPTRIQKVKNYRKQTSYACKPRPARRIEFNATSKKATARYHWLRADQQIDLAVWLRCVGPEARHFVLNMRHDGKMLSVTKKKV